MNVVLKPSDRKDKKYQAVIDGGRTVHFGAIKQNGQPYSDFTKHKDEERKRRYISRHSQNEDWSNPNTAGFYARWILWNKPTITQSVEDVNNKFRNVHIKLKT